MYLVFLLVTLVVSCPPPLNNFAFLGNETHNSAQLIEAALAPTAGLGWTEVVSAFLENPVTLWPKDPNDNTNAITYCYANEKVKLKVGQRVSDGIQLWV